MRKFISSAIKALADFIEFDEALNLGIQNGALNDLGKRQMATAQRTALLERYARTWSGGTLTETGSVSRELDLAQAEVKARRLERKRAAKIRELDRQAAREWKELGYAH